MLNPICIKTNKTIATNSNMTYLANLKLVRFDRRYTIFKPVLRKTRIQFRPTGNKTSTKLS